MRRSRARTGAGRSCPCGGIPSRNCSPRPSGRARALDARQDGRCMAELRVPPIAVTIAGSDSSGGAGIQADLKTFSALETYGASVITALTAQSTLGVFAIHDVPPDFVRAQIDAVYEDLAPKATKLGMLSRAETIRAVARGLRE